VSQSAFWDTSAIVPLCTRQQTTQEVEQLAKKFNQVVWWAAGVELHSAIARLRRLGELNEAGKLLAINALNELIGTWREIALSDELRDHAQSLLHSNSLRAADSLQLAAALIWCNQETVGKTFISSDVRLTEAASRSGFTIVRPGVSS
jgi:predicted nucleic acid-binding protein